MPCASETRGPGERTHHRQRKPHPNTCQKESCRLAQRIESNSKNNIRSKCVPAAQQARPASIDRANTPTVRPIFWQNIYHTKTRFEATTKSRWALEHETVPARPSALRTRPHASHRKGQPLPEFKHSGVALRWPAL